MAFKQENSVAIAEGQSEELNKLARLLDDAAWALDSALSAKRKDAAGYRRQNAANLTGGESFDQDDLDAAIRNARAILASCNPLQDLIARRAAHAASLAATEVAADPLSFADQVAAAERLNAGAGNGGLSFLRGLLNGRPFRGFA